MSVASRRHHILALIAAAAAWGIATVIAKRALAEIPPLTLLPIQLAVSVILLAGAILVRGGRRFWPPEMRRLSILGILNPGISYALGLVGLTYITASLSVLLWATEPIMILGLAWWLLGDRITGPMAAAAGIALLGVLLVVFQPGGSGQPIGIALTLLGVAACAVYTVVSRKWLIAESTLQVVATQQASALVFALLLLGSLIMTNGEGALAEISPTAWASAVVSGALYYAVAFWLFLTGLRRTSAAVAGMYINLIPVFGIAASYALLGERLVLRQWIGAVLIVIAVGFVVTRRPLAIPRP